MCVDRGRKTQGPPVTLQRTHFRPTLPYPGACLGPGKDGLVPMAPYVVRQVGAPPYNLKPIAGPSSTGPYTVYSGFDQKGGEEFGVGPSRGAGHNMGLG